MDICMTVLTDGRKSYIEQALPTWIEAYDDQIKNKFIIDDSGDADYRLWLRDTFPSFTIVPVSDERRGYSEAMRKVFSTVIKSKNKYCLHTEDDFILHRPFVIKDVISVLDIKKECTQMSFMRQPWYPNEVAAGGVVEALEGQEGASDYTQVFTNGHYWVKHKGYWTCNPSIFPSWVAQTYWPDPPWSEMNFAQTMFRHRNYAGIWGNRSDWVCVEHIGRSSNGTNY